MTRLIDSFQRRIDYLRVSVTDRCDLRCTYCLPKGFKGFEEPAHWLRHEEMSRLVGLFVGLGVSKVRLTGGEPLLRRGVTDLARQIAALPGLRGLKRPRLAVPRGRARSSMVKSSSIRPPVTGIASASRTVTFCPMPSVRPVSAPIRVWLSWSEWKNSRPMDRIGTSPAAGMPLAPRPLTSRNPCDIPSSPFRCLYRPLHC
mgnify:CR=1 FL=1